MEYEKIIRDAIGSERIESIEYEGAHIVVYINDKKFFYESDKVARELASQIKKRVYIRMDPAFVLKEDEAEVEIKKIFGEYSKKIRNIWFEEKRSLVIIELYEPEAIKDINQILNKIKRETLWTPTIRRAPIIPSKVVDVVRFIRQKESEYIRKFLNDLGERIYRKWSKTAGYWIRATFLGGVRTVGASCILIQTKDSKILLDAGVNFGGKGINLFPRFDVPEFSVNDIDAIVISHAHMDHVGALPLIFKYGYRGPVYVTPPTLDLMVLLQLDFIDVCMKKGEEPPYSSKEIHEMIKHVVPLEYGQVTDITPDIRLTFYPAGHILGSALIHLNIGNGTHNILYTGDFKFIPTKLHDPARHVFERVETLIIESTYGGKEDIQPNREESYKMLIDIIDKTIKGGGKVLIPVLGVGRAQEVMLIVEEAIRENKLPKDLEVFVDGSIWDTTAVYTVYPEYLRKELRDLIIKENINPFISDSFVRVSSDKDRESIIFEKGPCVIISTSGMLEGGPSVEYFRHLCEDEKNSIIFVSYQAPGTLGRRVISGSKEVQIETRGGDIETRKVNASIYKIDGLSGHADRNELMNYVMELRPKPKRVIVVHGEKSKSFDLASTIHKTVRVETNVPRVLDALRIY